IGVQSITKSQPTSSGTISTVPVRTMSYCSETAKRELHHPLRIQRKRRRATTNADYNSKELQAMIQVEAYIIQAQANQICAQNEIIKKLQEDDEKFTQKMQKPMLTLGLNNSTVDGSTDVLVL
ncbi:hypothetical protein C5167_015736, partial [Papaver somniferum]